MKEYGKKVKLCKTSCEKDLGVYIDETLSFNDHRNKQVNKARSIA